MRGMRETFTGHRRDESGFRHGLRVRIGSATGPRGKLFHCNKRDGSGKYWSVKLNDGRWVWPDDLIVDGPGDHVSGHCLDCRLRFIGDVGDLICRACQGEIFGTDEQRSEGARDQSFTNQRITYSSRPRRR